MSRGCHLGGGSASKKYGEGTRSIQSIVGKADAKSSWHHVASKKSELNLALATFSCDHLKVKDARSDELRGQRGTVVEVGNS